MTDVIADEIWYRGYRIAVLAQDGVPASVMADFLDDLSNGELFSGVVAKCEECNAEAVILHLHDCKSYQPEKEVCNKAEAYEAAADDILRDTKPFTKAGLIRRADLERVCKELKEETP